MKLRRWWIIAISVVAVGVAVRAAGRPFRFLEGARLLSLRLDGRGTRYIYSIEDPFLDSEGAAGEAMLLQEGFSYQKTILRAPTPGAFLAERRVARGTRRLSGNPRSIARSVWCRFDEAGNGRDVQVEVLNLDDGIQLSEVNVDYAVHAPPNAKAIVILTNIGEPTVFERFRTWMLP